MGRTMRGSLENFLPCKGTLAPESLRTVGLDDTTSVGSYGELYSFTSSTARRRPERPKQHCLQLIILYIYFCFTNIKTNLIIE